MESTASKQQPHTDSVRDALVSIVVPVYRTEAYLAQCVESLLCQTHRELELIFVDDGSPDGCPAMLDAYAERDARVRVIHKRNGGVSAARNDGIDAATGDFIGFVDSDDWTEPTYVERLLEIFSAHPEIGVAVCCYAVHDHPHGKTAAAAANAGRVLSPRDALSDAVDLGRNFDGNLWNKLFRAEIFRETENGRPKFRLDPSVSIAEDLLLVAQIFASGRSAYYCADRLYHYRYRDSSALRTSVQGRESEFAARERIEAICARFDKKLLRTAQLGGMKSALNLLTTAKETHRPAERRAMRRRVNAKLLPLMFARELPLYERLKLPVRSLFPVCSMRIFRRRQRRRG